MIIIKKPEEIEKMRQGGEILAKILRHIKKEVKPGITTKKLDSIAESLIYKNNATPSFKNFSSNSYQDIKYPAALCTSVNDEVVHGIPSKRKLKEGDIISLDLGVCFKGFYTDAAITVPVGNIGKNVKKMIDVTKKALNLSIKKIRPKNRIGDISSIIQETIENADFSVVRDCVGHGVGKFVHEDPAIPNFGESGTGKLLKTGMTLAIEPISNLKRHNVEICQDGWTVKACDGSISSHFEWTVAVTEDGYDILTPI